MMAVMAGSVDVGVPAWESVASDTEKSDCTVRLQKNFHDIDRNTSYSLQASLMHLLPNKTQT